MATLYAVNTLAVVGLHQRANTKDVTPRMSTIDKTYVMTGAEAANDVIRLARLHQGDRILCHLSLVTSDGISTTCTLSIGDEGTVDIKNATLQAAVVNRYASALDVAASGVDPFGTGGAAAIPEFSLLGDTWLTAKFITLTVPVAGKKLRVIAVYSGA